GDGIEPGGLRADIAIARDVGSVDDLGQALKRGVPELVLEEDRFEAAAAVHVAELDVPDVVRRRTFGFSHRHHLFGGHIEEFRLRINEAFDQPGAGYPIDLGILPRYPLHVLYPLLCTLAK